MGIAGLGKPAGTWCEHCKIDHGCAIYDARPFDCRQFQCGFLTQPTLKEEWRPSRSKIVLAISPDGKRIVAHVDPDRPGAWKRAPYHPQLRSWAATVANSGGQILVCIGKHTFVIFPDRDVEVGPVEEDEVVLSAFRPNGSGPRHDVLKLPRTDPKVAELLRVSPVEFVDKPQETS